MNLKEHLEVAWQNTLKFIGPVILLTLVQCVIVIFSLGIMAPVTTAGYLQSLLRALRQGRTPEIRDLFSEMSLFLPLFGFFLLATIAAGIGFLFLVLPGFAVIAFIVFATMYMIPLMTDKHLGMMDALKGSWEMATRPPLTDQIIVSLVYVIIVSIGGSVPFGFLVTQPLAMFLLLSVYLGKLGESGSGKASEPVSPVPPPPPADLPPPPPPPSPEQAGEA
jgi:hypothetical protein